MKGVGSMRRAILRGGLRLRGGTVMVPSVLEEEGEAKSWLNFVVEEDFLFVVVAALGEEAGENANDEEMAKEAMTAAE